MTGTAQQRRRDAIPDGRDETETERLDRNWGELLQELRVLETGTQILTGFLLTVAFQQRFAELNDGQVGLYIVLVSLSALSAVLALAPVSLHRLLFRQGRKDAIVRWTDRLLRIALTVVALTIVGVVMLVLDVATDITVGIVGGVVAAVVIAGLWLALPLGLSRHQRR
jgi:hypothetical protein